MTKPLERYLISRLFRVAVGLVDLPVGMHNDLTRLLGIHVPVIGAPMAGVSATDLSAAVAKAGGIGLIGAGCMDSDGSTRQQFSSCAATMKRIAPLVLDFSITHLRR